MNECRHFLMQPNLINARNIRLAFGALLFIQLIAAYAEGSNDLKTCLDMQDKVPAAQALECYKRVAMAQQEQADLHIPMQPRTLTEEWMFKDGVPLQIYKPTYFLFTHTANPNDTPTSPNLQNQVTSSYPQEHREAKFQFSFKSALFNSGRHTVWGAYTQQSFWQVFDTRHSHPFRETNYEPELIYSYRPATPESESTPATSFLNFALVHQSNGQSLPRSRGWNRIYIQAGFQHAFDNHDRIALIPRYWKRVSRHWRASWSDSQANDGNPDILNYLGHGDIELRYYHGDGMISALLRSRSRQLDLAIPLDSIGIQNVDLHLQYFHGFGESLIDYNQRHTTYGFGISIPLEDTR